MKWKGIEVNLKMETGTGTVKIEGDNLIVTTTCDECGRPRKFTYDAGLADRLLGRLAAFETPGARTE